VRNPFFLFSPCCVPDPMLTTPLLGQAEEIMVPHVFVLMVLKSDGYLAIRRPLTGQEERAARFFRISDSLPMELQMILCNRFGGLSGNFVLSQSLEVALTEVVKTFKR